MTSFYMKTSAALMAFCALSLLSYLVFPFSRPDKFTVNLFFSTQKDFLNIGGSLLKAKMLKTKVRSSILNLCIYLVYITFYTLIKLMGH